MQPAASDAMTVKIFAQGNKRLGARLPAQNFDEHQLRNYG
jgi:hypothetical protein